MSSKNQNPRVLAALRRAGQHGICQPDFLLPDVIDGQEPITRLPARILDLKADGHKIGAKGRRSKCKVYVLLKDATPAEDSKPRPVVGLSDRMFTPPPRLAIFDDEDVV